jgi:hypothetical protein
MASLAEIDGSDQTLGVAMLQLSSQRSEKTDTQPSALVQRMAKYQQDVLRLQYSEMASRMPRPAINFAQLQGVTAPLSEDGYKAVVSLRNDDQTKDFARRVLAANGRGLKAGFEAEGALNALAQRYSGNLGVASLMQMQHELLGAAWASRDLDSALGAGSAEQIAQGMTGATAPLTDAGYHLVAALRSDAQMKAYMARVAPDEGIIFREGSSLADGFLNGLAPYYSGLVAEQGLERLRKELREKGPQVVREDGVA